MISNGERQVDYPFVLCYMSASTYLSSIHLRLVSPRILTRILILILILSNGLGVVAYLSTYLPIYCTRLLSLTHSLILSPSPSLPLRIIQYVTVRLLPIYLSRLVNLVSSEVYAYLPPYLAR